MACGTIRHFECYSLLDVNAGTDIHPADKLDVGKRLAQVARKVAYGEAVACENPRFKNVSIEGTALRVTFDCANGLHVAVPPWLGPDATVPSATEPASFAVCGADGVWQWAKARIDGSTIILTSNKVAAPVAAAFAWAPNP
jgi:sialate O-acetylesterase